MDNYSGRQKLETQNHCDGRPAANNRRVLVLTSIAAFMAALDVTIVNVALPSIQAGVGGDISGLQWIVAGYTLIFGSLLLAGGTLSDRYGARNAFVLGIGVFSIGSLLCGLSTSLTQLNLARILQGCGAALIVPSTLALLRESFPDRDARARAIAIYAASGGIAQVSGPVLGGFLVSELGWRWIFFVNVPLGSLILLASLRMPRSKTRTAREFDFPGQITAILSLGLLAAGLIEGGRVGWFSLPTISYLALSLVALIGFILVERNSKAPMIPLEVIKDLRTASLLGVAIILGFSYFGQFFILAIFFQEAWGATPILAGLAFLPMTVGVTVANLTIGPSVGRIGSRIPIFGGQLLCAIGYLFLSFMSAGTSYLPIGIVFAVVGVGGGLIVPAMTAAMLESVSADQSGIASGLLNAGRQMGSVIGIALFGSLAAQAGLVRGLQDALVVAAIAMAFGCVLALLAVGEKPRLFDRPQTKR